MRSRFLIILISCNFIALIVDAQILNIEKYRLDSISKAKPFQVMLNADINFYNRSATEEEKAEFFEFTNEFNAVYAPGSHAYIAIGEYNYKENNGNIILNNAYSHIRANFLYRKRWSYEAFAQAQEDRFRGLRRRYLLGATVRWKAIESKKFSFDLGLGPMMEYESWVDVETGEERTLRIPKLNSYFIARWDVNENLNLNTVVYYQVGYDDRDKVTRHRVSNTVNLNVRITGHFSLTSSMKMAYEDKPIFPITKFIYTFENGVSFRF